jgi:SAM-dependent methyltransferase
VTHTRQVSTPHYDAAYFQWQDPIGETMARVYAPVIAVHVDRDDHVVDFGCGGGHLLTALDVRSRTGIEVNPSAAAYARARGIRVVAKTLELDDGIADVVVSTHALEHVRDPYQELCRLRRVLRPGGKLVLWLPIDDWRARDRGADPHRHLFTWTPRLLRNLLVEAGFSVESCQVLTHVIPPRHYRLLHRLLPKRTFDLVCWLTAVLLRRRQLIGVALRA